jgi:hypothetical protein
LELLNAVIPSEERSDESRDLHLNRLYQKYGQLALRYEMQVLKLLGHPLRE